MLALSHVSRHELSEAELFFRELMGEAEPGYLSTHEAAEDFGINVLGCRLGRDPGAFVDCLNKRVDRQVAAATRNLQAQLASAQRDAQHAARRALREAGRADAVQQILDQANTQLRQFANAVIVRSEWQKVLFTGLQSLPLGNLMACMQDQALAGNLGLGPAIQQFASDPARFVQTVLQEIVQKGGQEFSQLVTKELTSLVERGEFPKDTELVARSMDMLGVLIGRQGAGKCVFDEFRPQLEAASNQLLQLARETVQHLQAKATELIEQQMLPALLRPTGDLLNNIILSQIRQQKGAETEALPPQITALLLTQDEAKAMARQVLFKRNVQQRFEAAQVSLERLLDPATTQTQLQTHIADLQNLIKGTQDFEPFYAEIAIRMIEAMGHKYLESNYSGVNRGIGGLP